MKTLKYINFIFVLLFLSSFAVAQEISVVDVKRNITLADDDNIYKDFYINAGEGSALRKNLVVKVKRRVTIKESPTKNIGDFETVVGQLKVIHVGNKVSVAREFKLLPRDEEPMLEQIGIMSGDKIDLTGSFIDYSKPQFKTKTSENAPPTEETIKTATQTDSTTTTKATDATSVTPVTNVGNVPTITNPTPEPTNDMRKPANNERTLLDKIIPMPGI